MARDVQIVIPTFKRPNNIIETEKQLKGHDIVWVCHHTDKESQDLVKSLGYNPVIDTQPPSGVNATNAGYWATTAEWVVIGQDDFKWHLAWLEKAWKWTAKYQVIGFNDGSNSARHQHSVGWLVNRQFVQDLSLCLDFPNVIFNPHYKKNFSDTELNDTAKSRGVWKYADDAILEHLHPTFNKGENDITYQHLETHLAQDINLYNSRKHLWQ